MPHAPTPWVSLAALLAMFLLPFLPAWLFEGPRTVKHRPRRHVCGECGLPRPTATFARPRRRRRPSSPSGASCLGPSRRSAASCAG
jgi:hypothetical protein